MPHISKKKLDEQILAGLENHIASLIRDSGSQTRIRIFKELLTKTEKIMLAKRIGTILLLKKGLSSYKTSEVLGISPSTAERFERDMESNRYRATVEWIWKNSRAGRFETFIMSFVRLAFTRRTHSFNKFVEEL